MQHWFYEIFNKENKFNFVFKWKTNSLVNSAGWCSLTSQTIFEVTANWDTRVQIIINNNLCYRPTKVLCTCKVTRIHQKGRSTSRGAHPGQILNNRQFIPVSILPKHFIWVILTVSDHKLVGKIIAKRSLGVTGSVFNPKGIAAKRVRQITINGSVDR